MRIPLPVPQYIIKGEEKRRERWEMKLSDAFLLNDGFQDGIKSEKINTQREKERADAEKIRADTAENRADAEKNRANAAEQELLRLREELLRLRGQLAVGK